MIVSSITSSRLHNWRRQPKRGIVLVAILVLMAVSLTLFGIWGRRAILEQNQLEMRQMRLQAIRLAEAGVERAVALRAADPKFESETWLVPPEQLDQKHSAEVRIKVAPANRGGTLHYLATAEFPAGELRRVQITKSIELARLSPNGGS